MAPSTEQSPARPSSSSSSSSSPDFEFCPSLSHPPLLTADELFSGGVLLPLHLLSLPSNSEEPPLQEGPPASDELLRRIGPSAAASPSASKRFRDLFRVAAGDKKPEEKDKKPDKKDKKSSPELNINIWPFSRSRSAGNNSAASSRPKQHAAARKASSAPCSRSNSGGGRRWASSPGRPGVPVGRASPVWQFRKPPSKVTTENKKLNGIRGINLNVNTCIGYRSQGRCRGDDKDGVRIRAEDGGGNGGLFSLKTLFSKKVY